MSRKIKDALTGKLLYSNYMHMPIQQFSLKRPSNWSVFMISWPTVCRICLSLKICSVVGESLCTRSNVCTSLLGLHDKAIADAPMCVPTSPRFDAGGHQISIMVHPSICVDMYARSRMEGTDPPAVPSLVFLTGCPGKFAKIQLV